MALGQPGGVDPARGGPTHEGGGPAPCWLAPYDHSHCGTSGSGSVHLACSPHSLVRVSRRVRAHLHAGRARRAAAWRFGREGREHQRLPASSTHPPYPRSTRAALSPLSATEPWPGRPPGAPARGRSTGGKLWPSLAAPNTGRAWIVPLGRGVAHTPPGQARAYPGTA